MDNILNKLLCEECVDGYYLFSDQITCKKCEIEFCNICLTEIIC